MSTYTPTSIYIDAIAHMPAGSTLTIPDVTWENYEQLLHDLGDSSSVRVSYDNGKLEIMSPLLSHEVWKDLINRVVDALALHLGVDVEICGSTTFKHEQLAGGVEPDTCFYVQNYQKIIGKGRIDLSVDPPPDIAVEIDLSHSAINKPAFYSSLRVPEFWRYDERHMRIYHLVEGKYVEVPAGSTFPILTSELLTDLLERCKTEGQSGSLRWFRKWLLDQS